MAPLPTLALDADALAARGHAEWLLTNGLGGFALGAANDIPDRRYHAWLVAATRPPLGRIVALHSVAAWLVIEEEPADAPPRLRRFGLSSYRFRDGSVGPAVPDHLVRFEKGFLSAAWTMRVPGLDAVTVTRELILHRAENAASVRYRVTGLSGVRAWLELRPFTPLRDFHHLHTGIDTGRYALRTPAEDLATVILGGASVSARVPGARFAPDTQVWYGLSYARDRLRAQDHVEDMYSPGVFVAPLEPSPGASAVAVLTAWAHTDAGVTPHGPGPDVDAAMVRERERLGALVAAARRGVRDDADAPLLDALVCAADQFVVVRDAHAAPRPEGAEPDDAPARLTTVIAGYPWFSDWGRDTLIALPGLLLSCGRLDEARAALRAFAALRKNGLCPNCFDDAGGGAQHNTVDASLWFVRAACAWAREAGREPDTDVRAACLEIIDAYRRGTDFKIRVDEDGLVRAGDPSTQLTWMDAARDGVVFTPRWGKPVEISALWYCALMELSETLARSTPRTSRELAQLAGLTAASFEKAFWNSQAGCLFDCLVPTSSGGWEGSPEIRPNQVFAASVPHSPLSRERRAAMLRVVREKLLTPLGLRTLDPADPRYRPRYEGTMFDRDGAYHNGTVWPWLLGPFAEGVMRADAMSTASRSDARTLLAPLVAQLMGTGRDAAPGAPLLSLPEIYDAEGTPDRPRRPEGCPAQAWSVAEVLRVWRMAGV